ncbi:alpha-hydroxy-acid oxidizing protein [Paenibacillus chartarius]|uniref:L-lactate oxidase n=1 Tax=Paenibacillus chartarius TaxID=747481 RepID=A0ABV6DTQ6_9BACL
MPIDFHDWENEARKKLGAGPFGYVHGGAGAGDTIKANSEGFQKYRLIPRACCNVANRDLTIDLLGHKFKFPLMMAPIGVNSICHPSAEQIPAEVAAELEVPYILSNVSTISLEEAAQHNKNGVRWFQLYPPKDKDLTKSFIDRAQKAGYTAIVVTVDSKLLGWREEDLRNQFLPFLSGQGMGNYFSDPVFRSKLKKSPKEDLHAAVELALSEGNNEQFSWEDFSLICRYSKLPVLLKGVTHPEDALLAVQHGASGIIVSNHGGRQLDGAIGTLEALPDVVEKVKDEVPVLMDSGIRRGADVIKAIALGAKAVLVGRPYIYGLAVAGKKGVTYVLENLIAETELQMAICGRSSIKDVDSRLIKKI